MHTLGKVMLGLVLVATVGTVALAAKLLEQRNTWTKSLTDVKTDNERFAGELVAKRDELRRLRQDYAQIMVPWDRYWNDEAVEVTKTTPTDPSITLRQLGTRNGLGVPAGPEPPVVHLFMPGAEQPVYVGPFQVQANGLREDQAVLKPMWTVRGTEAAGWTNGPWRVRSLIPSPQVEQFAQLQNALGTGDELLAAKEKSVTLQTALLDRAKEQQSLREQELLGFTVKPDNAEILGQEFSDGLVKALETEEAERDRLLVEVDRLRRELKGAVDRQNALRDRNQRLAGSLPGGAPAPTTEVSSK